MNAKRALAALAVTVALAGCSAPADDKPDGAAGDLTSTMEDAGDAADDGGGGDLKAIARAALRKQQPALTAAITDDQIDELAAETCAAFDAGATPVDMVIASMDAGLEAETGSVMMMAAMAYCPEHRDMVEEFGEGGGY